MKTKMLNNTHIEGYVYEHKLDRKVSGEKSKNPGVEFINGTLSIATDNELTNVVQVHFSYVTELTANKKPNATYTTLSNIIDGKIGSVMEHGKENAGKVRVDSAIGLNEWFDSRNNNALVSVKRNEGGFVHSIQELNANENQRSTFEVDILITGVTRLEEDSERALPERATIKGCIFDFRKTLLPVEFTAYNPKAIDYFEGLGASSSNPVFTTVRGSQVSKTVVKKTEEEGAFGDVYIKETTSSQRDFVITWAAQFPYEWDSEETILASELSKAISDRELYLAELKQRQEEYRANSSNGNGAFAAATSSTGSSSTYDF